MLFSYEEKCKGSDVQNHYSSEKHKWRRKKHFIPTRLNEELWPPEELLSGGAKRIPPPHPCTQGIRDEPRSKHKKCNLPLFLQPRNANRTIGSFWAEVMCVPTPDRAVYKQMIMGGRNNPNSNKLTKLINRGKDKG